MARRRRESAGRVSARRRAEEHSSGFEGTSIRLPEGFSFFQVKSKGKKTVFKLDFFPYRVGKGNPWADEGEVHFERTFWVHRRIGIDPSTYVCPRKTAGQRCPICEDVDRKRDDESVDADSLKALLPKERQLWIVRDVEEGEDSYSLWDYSYHLFGKQLDNRIKDADEEDEYEFFASLKGGQTLRVGFSEESYGGGKYYECSSIDFKSREDLPASLLDEMPCLDDLLVIRPYDELQAIYLGEDLKDKDDEEEKPRRRRRPPKKEEEDDDDVQGVITEEDEKLLKKNSKRRPKKAEPEPEGDDGWDDDEEEEKPKPKKRGRPKKAEPEPELEEEDEDDGWDDEEEEEEKKRGSRKKKQEEPRAEDSDDEDDWDW